MSQITREHILKLASLSKLTITENEIDRYIKELSAILEYVGRLDAVDVTGLEPTYQVSGLQNQFRESDEVTTQQAKPDTLMSMVPHSKDGYIKVGRMI